MIRNIHFVDTTLRDGEQAPNISFTPEQRIKLAHKLAECGVPEIESGIPIMGANEQVTLRELNHAGLPCRLTAWCRATENDLRAAMSCGYRSVHISLPISNRLLRTMNRNEVWVFEQLETLLPKAVSQFDYVSVGLQDASRTPASTLVRLAAFIEQLGAHRLRLADSVGYWTPAAIQEVIPQVHYTISEMSLGVHMHNDFGMATANTITAIQCGATDADVTVNGLGERAGNAALEQVALALKILPEFEHDIHTEKLDQLCQAVSTYSGRPIPNDQPIVGADVFRHESGIHVRALLEDQSSFEPFSASLVGRENSLNIVAGKHSGTSSIQYLLQKLGIPLQHKDALVLLPQVRERAEQLGRGLSLIELQHIYQQMEIAV